MDLTQEKTEVLWGLISEISKSLSVRELTTASERTGLYKDVTAAMNGIMNALLEEINNRKPDSSPT